MRDMVTEEPMCQSDKYIATIEVLNEIRNETKPDYIEYSYRNTHDEIIRSYGAKQVLDAIEIVREMVLVKY